MPSPTPPYFPPIAHPGYAQWQVDRSQDEVFLAAQEAAGQHRDAQGRFQSSYLHCVYGL